MTTWPRSFDSVTVRPSYDSMVKSGATPLERGPVSDFHSPQPRKPISSASVAKATIQPHLTRRFSLASACGTDCGCATSSVDILTSQEESKEAVKVRAHQLHHIAEHQDAHQNQQRTTGDFDEP